MMTHFKLLIALVTLSAVSANTVLACIESQEKIKVADCHKIIDGNVTGDAKYTYSSFPVEFLRIKTVWGRCDGTPPVKVVTTDEIRLNEKFNGDYAAFFSGVWQGPMPGPSTVTMTINDVGQTVETAQSIEITQRLTGDKTVITRAFYNKQNKTLELKTTERKAFIPATIGHILLQCE